MKLVLSRYHLEIVPEDTLDEVYIEEVLGLKRETPETVVRRVPITGGSPLAYLEIRKKD